MAKHIDILLTGPPSVDFPAFVGVQDEHGQPVEGIGQWIAPDDEWPFWRYRLTPAELLMHMIAEDHVGALSRVETNIPAATPPPRQTLAALGSDGLAARRALKDRLKGVKPKRDTQPPAPATAAPDPLATQQCPACHLSFNPAQYDLIDCPNCGESKCSAHCYGDQIAGPCLDCQALIAGPDEGGFEPPPEIAPIKSPELRAKMAAESAGAKQAVGGRLFDDTFHGRGGDSAAEDEDE